MSTDGAANGVRERLEQAARGLVYLSEGDAPFTWVHFPAATPADLTPEGVARLAGVPPAQVEARDLGRFFAGQIEEADPNDPVLQGDVPRVRALRDALGRELPGARAFRIGTVDVRCLLLGRLPDGTLGGLETRALET